MNDKEFVLVDARVLSSMASTIRGLKHEVEILEMRIDEMAKELYGDKIEFY